MDDPPAPSWNVAPTDPVRIVVQRTHDDDGPAPRQLRTVAGGCSRTGRRTARGGAKMINARSETVASKPAFKRAAGRRRCLVPANGYYEWQRDGGRKLPHFLSAPDERLIAMAGLYEIWRDDTLPDDDPAALALDVHGDHPAGHGRARADPRPLPGPGPGRAAQRWLDCSSGDAATARRTARAMPEPHLEPRAVSQAVGNVKNNGPELIEPRGRRAGRAAELF